MKRVKLLLPAAVALAAWLLFVPASSALAEELSNLGGRVLILHSHNPGLTWTDEEMCGVMDEFYQTDPQFEPYVEYLDWKRFPWQNNLESLAGIFRSKYADKPLDLVVAVDNAALDFALKYRSSIFHDAAVTFCGITGYRQGMFAGQPRLSGSVGDVDALGTIDSALSLFPLTKKVLVLTEPTDTGLSELEAVKKAQDKYRGRLEFAYFDNPTIEEVVAEAKSQTEPAILLVCSFQNDRAGRSFPDFAVGTLSARCPLPVFSLWDFLMGKGILGGSLLSGRDLGRDAARIGLRMLAGEENIPIETAPARQNEFDYRQLAKFEANLGDLPPGSLLLGQTVSFYQRNRMVIWGGALAIMVMISGMFVLSLNIVARRRVERELEKTKALLHAAIDGSPAGIMIAEAPDIVVTLANPAAERILGVPQDAENKLSYLREGDVGWKAFRPDGTPYDRLDLILPQTILKGVTAQNLEMRIVRPDGQECWILLNGAPVLDNSGQIIAGIIVFADITERRHMDEMMIQTEKMTSIGGLAAGMAHEINNPLGIIVHGAQNALRRISLDLSANQEAARAENVDLEAVNRYLHRRNIPLYIQDIIDAGLRASKIVRSMLNFSRQGNSTRASHHVDQLLEKAVELVLSDYDLKRNYDTKKIRFVRDFGASVPKGLFSETEIVQIFLNIIKNAAQAMASKHYPDNQPPTITLRTRYSHGFIQVEIEDNGPGMDAKTAKRSLEPFYTTKPVGEGTGLGLSVSYFIVTNYYGGELHVTSSPDEGSRFTICLPPEKVLNAKS